MLFLAMGVTPRKIYGAQIGESLVTDQVHTEAKTKSCKADRMPQRSHAPIHTDGIRHDPKLVVTPATSEQCGEKQGGKLPFIPLDQRIQGHLVEVTSLPLNYAKNGEGISDNNNAVGKGESLVPVQTEEFYKVMLEFTKIWGLFEVEYLKNGFQLVKLNHKRVWGWQLAQAKAIRKFFLDKLGVFCSLPKRGRGLKKSWVPYFSYTQKPYKPGSSELEDYNMHSPTKVGEDIVEKETWYSRVKRYNSFELGGVLNLELNLKPPQDLNKSMDLFSSNVNPMALGKYGSYRGKLKQPIPSLSESELAEEQWA